MMTIEIAMKVSEEIQKISNENLNINNNNNSIVFSWKYPIEWYVISIPHGRYTIEELGEQLNQRITDISAINSPLKIQRISNGNTINVEITYHTVVIDIYQSSIRTTLGFSEHPREDSLSFLTYGVYEIEKITN